MDPVTVIITIAGLIKTSAKVAQVTLGFLSDIAAYPDEMNKLITSVRSMHGFLCSVEPVIARLEAQKTGFGGHLPSVCIEPTYCRHDYNHGTTPGLHAHITRHHGFP
jgi:hypothetical protein